MTTSPDFHELIYVSTLAPDASINAVPDISRQARVANPLLDITGLLVFDGQRFCQQIEGSMRMVVELFERISLDDRHGHISMVHQGTISEKRFRHFNVGYPLLEAGDTLQDIEGLQGMAAVEAFRNLMANVHMG